MKSDSQLIQQVTDELRWDTSVNEKDIRVEAEEGMVTLSGHLSNCAEKYAAELAAQRVVGVKGLVMDIDVRVPESDIRNDADIALAARNILGWNFFLPRKRIKITVENGWITLAGNVEYGYHRTAAKNSLCMLTGVKGINNNIAVRPVVPISSKSIKTEIENALQRRTHTGMQDITVTVEGDQVTLTGSVPGLSESRAVVRAASLTPGVDKVINRMTLS